MGIFDTIHMGEKRHQTKALGHACRELHVGDSVEAVYRSFTAQEYELSPAHRYEDGPEDFSFMASSDDLTDAQVSILVSEGRIVGYGEHPLNRFDSHGRSVGEVVWTPTIAENPAWTRVRVNIPRRTTPKGTRS